MGSYSLPGLWPRPLFSWWRWTYSMSYTLEWGEVWWIWNLLEIWYVKIWIFICNLQVPQGNHFKHSLKRNRQDDCQYVHGEVLYIFSRLHQLSRAVIHGLTDGSFLGWHCVMVITYTLLQKKCTLISSSSPSVPGSLTPTPGHVKFVKCSRLWENRFNFWHGVFCELLSRLFDKSKMTRGRGQWCRDFRKLGSFSCALLLEKSVCQYCFHWISWNLKAETSYMFRSPKCVNVVTMGYLLSHKGGFATRTHPFFTFTRILKCYTHFSPSLESWNVHVS